MRTFSIRSFCAILLLAVFAGCFTYLTQKYVTDGQEFYHDVSSLTHGKATGQPYNGTLWGGIHADEAVLESDYAASNPISLSQLHTAESTLSIYELRDSIGASVEFFRENELPIDTTIAQLIDGENSKNTK